MVIPYVYGCLFASAEAIGKRIQMEGVFGRFTTKRPRFPNLFHPRRINPFTRLRTTLNKNHKYPWKTPWNLQSDYQRMPRFPSLHNLRWFHVGHPNVMQSVVYDLDCWSWNQVLLTLLRHAQSQSSQANWVVLRRH